MRIQAIGADDLLGLGYEIISGLFGGETQKLTLDYLSKNRKFIGRTL